ncbi:hypothetical protein DPX16_16168 [Anabarilius grahami]|uniref:Uncharacterized protein n=1 Tax=Anabarilius grahami TaxID=495550 RepID=A0A3N0YH60_ANAGA|nr:hypothetical protein DPX16_16168 [Anabarilius grahami]
MGEDLKKANTHNGRVPEVLEAKKHDQPKAAVLHQNVSIRERESYSLWAHYTEECEECLMITGFRPESIHVGVRVRV